MIWIAPSEKDTATDTLEKRLRDAADVLVSRLRAALERSNPAFSQN